MQIQWSQRARYEPSGRIDWVRFIPWALGTMVAVILIGAGLNWLYSTGWYILPVPILTGLFAGVLVLLSISRGKCRSPAVGTLFGLLVGVLLYGSYLYFGMLALLGPRAAARLDLLPKYIEMRVRTDTSHDLSESNRTFTPPDPVMNGFRLYLEALWILVFTTAAGYRRSKRSFCEQCGNWKQQDLVFFPPGNGKTIVGWLSEGRLDYLAEVPLYSPRGRNRQATLVALERCQPAQAGCSYYLAVKDATSASGLGRFDSAFGRIRAPRVEITPDEVAALAPIFPAAELSVPANPHSPTAPGGPSIVARSALIEVAPIPIGEARQVLTPLHITIATSLTLSILLFFYAGIVGCFVGFHFVMQQLDPRFARHGALLWWLTFLAVSAVVAISSGFIGLRNSSIIGNLYYRFISRRSIARRRLKWVDPSASRGSSVHFVQIVPRQNWATMKWETATDTGFLEIDAVRKEPRFEGDVQRYRIPAAAITGFSIAHYSTSPRLKYSVVVLQRLTASGPWEAPISLRATKLFLPKDHRQQSAQMLQDQIAAVLPVAQAAIASQPAPVAGTPQTPPPLPLTDYAYSRPTDLKPRTVWGSRLFWRVGLFFAIFGFSVWRGFNLAHQRVQQRNRLAQLMSAQTIEPGPTAPRLPLTITNLHFNQRLTETAPNYQPGGDWTVLECATADNSAGFTVAIENPLPVSPTFPTAYQFKAANVALLPADRTLAANLVARLATALNQPLPAPQTPGPLITTKFPADPLGSNLGDPHLGLQAGQGSWTAILWPMERDGLVGRIFFNYNPFTRSAELIGSGTAADADAIEDIALAIRDGKQPPRSEQNDPTFTSQGPTIVDLTSIPGSKNASADFSRTGNLLIYHGGPAPVTIHALDLRDHRRPITIAQFDGHVRSISSADDDDDHFLVFETIKDDALGLGSHTEHQIWWIDRSTNTRTQIKGPWGTNASPFGRQPISPDEKYCAISALSGTILDSNRPLDVYLVNLQTGNAVKADADHLAPGAWQGTGQDLRYIALKSDQSGKNSLAIDPQTGHCSPVQNSGLPDQTISPDGQLAFRLDAGKSLTITPTNGGPPRVLNFGPHDRRFAIDGYFQWLSPRYLSFAATPQSFIDVQPMKVGYLPTPATPAIMDEDDDDRNGYQFDRNFNWALAYTPDGLILGRVVTPPAAP